ncbi:MAG: Tfp pilus assembly protein FimV [Porticoccus sp.]|jgi:Tfp pilus assembly protein FimV
MKLHYFILAVGLLFANTVFALELGEIKLSSSLSEQLDMEIKLLDDSAKEELTAELE